METANAPVRAWLLRELDPRPGDTVLDLSAGAGETGFEIARPLGEHGRLISSDFASEMVDVAQRRGNELGLRNVAPISFRASAIGSWRRWRRRKRIHRPRAAFGTMQAGVQSGDGNVVVAKAELQSCRQECAAGAAQLAAAPERCIASITESRRQ